MKNLQPTSLSLIYFMSLIVLVAQANFASATNQTLFEKQAIEDEYKQPGFVRSKAYWVFGSKYYLPTMDYPSSAIHFLQPDSLHAVPFKNDEDNSRSGNGWNTIALGDAEYYWSEFHLHELDMSLDESISELLEHYRQRGLKKSYSDNQYALILNRSKVHIALFPKEQFGLKYHPGAYLLTHENGDQHSSTVSPRNGVQVEPGFTTVARQERHKLVGLFNGTYWNQDTIRRIDGKERRAGLIINGVTIDEPLPDMASIAYYRDGSFRMGSYRSLPDQGDITLLRQNEYPLINDGAIYKHGAYPTRWRRFNDEILMSYIFTSADDKYFGYAWTIHTPPSIFANLMLDLGMNNMMMVDIHPVINAVLASPRTDKYAGFNKTNSYPFVPIEKDVTNTLVRALATKLKGTIQYNPYTPLYGSKKDFFSISLH